MDVSLLYGDIYLSRIVAYCFNTIYATVWRIEHNFIKISQIR